MAAGGRQIGVCIAHNADREQSKKLAAKYPLRSPSNGPDAESPVFSQGVTEKELALRIAGSELG